MKRIALVIALGVLGGCASHQPTKQEQPQKFGASLIFPQAGGSSSGGGLTNAELRASPVPVSGTVTANAGSGTMAVSAAALPLPAGASTSAKQPALGTAGAASADVLSVQGIASMTPLLVNGSGVTQPVSGTVAVSGVGGTVAVSGPLTDTQLRATPVPVSGTVASTQSGTWTVQPGNTANTTAWKVDGSAVTQPISGTVTANAGTNLNTSALALDASLLQLTLAQGTTTSGLFGPLVQGGVSLFQPGYTADTISPLMMNKSGLLRVGLYGEVDAGAVRGTPWTLAPEVSEDFRLRVEIDDRLDGEVFNYTAQNTAKHRVDTTTMTVSYSAGFNTNASGITTLNTGAAISTYQVFSVLGSANNLCYTKVKFTGTITATNTTIDWGLFSRATTNPYAPTDGAFFRFTSAGVVGVTVNNGTTTTTSPFKVAFGGANWSPTIGTEYDTIVSINENVVVWWLDMRDGNGYTMVDRLNNTTAEGRPLFAGSVPFSVRHAIGGSAASAVVGLQVKAYTVNQGGLNSNRPWLETQGAMGAVGSQGTSGHSSLGSTALYTNSLAVGAGTAMTNTTAALGSGLGGQFAAQPTLAANTDGIVCSYQNPAPTVNLTGRVLKIDSIKISAVVTTAFTGGPVLYVYSAAWGHTSVSLATAEGANTKAPRRKPLGVHNFPVTSAVGVIPTGETSQIMIDDIFVQPGEFFQIVAKNVGTVTSAGVIALLVTINSHPI